METDTTERIRQWIDAQNAYTERLLERYPQREQVAERIDELLQIGWVDVPRVHGDVAFYEKRVGTEDQPKLYIRRAGQEPEVLIDVATLSEDGSVAMDWFYPSNDGSLLAYGLSEGGSERSTLHLMDVESRQDLADVIPHCRAGSVAWLSDNSGFYYTKYPLPGSVPEGDENYYRRVYFHEIGADPEADPLVFGEGRAKTNWPAVDISDDDTWLAVYDFVSFTQTEVFALNRDTGQWLTVVEGVDANFLGDFHGHVLYMMTNHEAPRFRVVARDLDQGADGEMVETIPEDSTATLDDFTVANNSLMVKTIRDVISHVAHYTLEGEFVAELPLEIGDAHYIVGNPDDDTAYFGFSSFFIPPVVFEYDVETREMGVFDRIESDIDFDAYETTQVMYQSKDGTLVPMFLAHRKGLELDGTNPTLLYGYGGFGSIMKPAFARNRFIWLENGGVYAQACIRGGGEYGEDWHRAGMLGNKQNSFDDFIAAAEWLIANDYTSSEKLVIRGGSNGGLLVAAVEMQRPELFRVVIAGAGVLDMLRFHKFHFGMIHTSEYGNPDDEEAFRYLYEYSPYHNVEDGVCYPATMFSASDTDTRVHHSHSMKMTARLQAANAGCHPIVLRLATDIGHGWGASRSRIVEELADEWTFVFEELDMTLN